MVGLHSFFCKSTLSFMSLDIVGIPSGIYFVSVGILFLKKFCVQLRHTKCSFSSVHTNLFVLEEAAGKQAHCISRNGFFCWGSLSGEHVWSEFLSRLQILIWENRIWVIYFPILIRGRK